MAKDLPLVAAPLRRSFVSRWSCYAGASLLLATLLYFGSTQSSHGQDATSGGGDSAAAGGVVQVPVEDDMHEFMEYAFEPGYGRLKAALAAAPADNAGWKTVKADSLVLAEGANLLLLRAPAEQQAEWKTLSAAVRDAGAQLYQAAKKKDYAASRQHYQAMLQQCNRCHDAFAGGEHQLKP